LVVVVVWSVRPKTFLDALPEALGSQLDAVSQSISNRPRRFAQLKSTSTRYTATSPLRFGCAAPLRCLPPNAEVSFNQALMGFQTRLREPWLQLRLVCREKKRKRASEKEK
jgi:hypothetical protein